MCVIVENSVDLVAVLDSGVVEFLFACLGCQQATLRALAGVALARFKQQIELSRLGHRTQLVRTRCHRLIHHAIHSSFNILM